MSLRQVGTHALTRHTETPSASAQPRRPSESAGAELAREGTELVSGWGRLRGPAWVPLQRLPRGPRAKVLASLEFSPRKALFGLELGLGVAPFLPGAVGREWARLASAPPSGRLPGTGLWSGAQKARGAGGGGVLAAGGGRAEPYLVQTWSDGGRGDENNERRELGGSQDLERLRTEHTGD